MLILNSLPCQIYYIFPSFEGSGFKKRKKKKKKDQSNRAQLSNYFSDRFVLAWVWLFNGNYEKIERVEHVLGGKFFSWIISSSLICSKDAAFTFLFSVFNSITLSNYELRFHAKGINFYQSDNTNFEHQIEVSQLTVSIA